MKTIQCSCIISSQDVSPHEAATQHDNPSFHALGQEPQYGMQSQ